MVLGGIIYLHDISILRFSGTARRNLEMFNRLCGDAALEKVVLCTNQWERVTHEDGERREAEMMNLHWKEMVNKGSQVRRFMGDQKSAWDIVSVFLQRASLRRQELGNQIALQIQGGIAVKRKIIPETKAGEELHFTLQEFREMQKIAIALEEMMAKGEDTDIHAELAETRRSMDKFTAQIRSLKVPLTHRIKRFLGLVVSPSRIVARFYHLYPLPCSERCNQSLHWARIQTGFSTSVFPPSFA